MLRIFFEVWQCQLEIKQRRDTWKFKREISTLRHQKKRLIFQRKFHRDIDIIQQQKEIYSSN